MADNSSSIKWHVTHWGAWGWAETVVKLVAIAGGLTAAGLAFSAGPIGFGLNLKLAAFIVFAFASLGAVFQLTVRLGQKEIVSLIFAILNLLGHLGLLWALFHPGFPVLLPVSFGALYVVAQLIKVQFLRSTGYTEQGADSAGIQRFTLVQALIYLIFAVLALF